MFRPLLNGLALLAVGALVLACDSKDPNAGTDPSTSASKDTATAPTPPPTPKPASAVPDRHLTFKTLKVQKGDSVVIDTSMGVIKFKFMDDTPKHVANFEKLADAGFYDGTAFHRVDPNFMIQGGDQNTLGTDPSLYGQGDPGWTVPAEFTKTKFVRGIVGMARSSDPNSAGSQFFIVVKDSPFLNNQYTAFGAVTTGMDVADKIAHVPNTGQPNNTVIDIDKVRVKSIKIVHPGSK